MSASDPREQFYTIIDDWYSNVFALRLTTKAPVNPRFKQKFHAYIEDRCAEVGHWSISDDEITTIFVQYLDYLAEW